MEQSLRPVLISQKAMATFLVESSSSIFEKDSIQSGQPILINSLKASFLTLSDTFNLHIDSITATLNKGDSITFNKLIVDGDKILYKKVNIPYLESVFMPDTLRVKVICEYVPYVDFSTFNWRGLQRNYIIEKNTIKLQNKWFN